MKIIFQIDGGIGKSVAATAVCKAVKAQYPNDKLIVVSAYPPAFLCNPDVDKALDFNNLSYFYQDHIQGQDFKIMAHNPYLETAFIEGKTHLIQVWCEMFGITYNGELPKVFVNNREQTFFTNQFAAQGLFQSGKPLLLIQTNGGGKDQPNKYSWARDMPMGTAQKIVDAFANDYTIVHIRRDDQLQLKNVIPMQADFRALAVLIGLSAKRVFIDSVCQHTAAALGMPSVVLMIDDTTRIRFGYDMHTNIIANPPTIKPELRHAVYGPYNISGIPQEFPYNHEGEIYDAEQIIEAVRKEDRQEPIILGEPKEPKNKKKEKPEVVE